MRYLRPATPPSSTTTSPTPLPIGQVIRIAIFAGAFTVILLSIFCIFLCKKKKKNTRTHPAPNYLLSPPKVDPSHVIMMPPVEYSPPPESNKTLFTYEDLANATQGFSDANIIGRGGFGYVHKGVLPTGEKVAIKRLKVGSRQGESEFQAEVATANRIHHKHLVSLVGHCTTGLERLLVYEFVPNNTLEYHLHGESSFCS
ncbi:proline-rich receptor-like protein kinase PERK1 [Helianthus annuus]|uniref:proline-rich receptor-like protein kinase PERK1 n=1 Tax=Helianthus annuus TaxID=4232 RepID=UPI0016530189|nr:proline-rich receptor-like protein kinase PERK1 [Helianthus annuus]